MTHTSASERTREELAKLLELRALELYRLLVPVSDTVARGVLSGLLSAAERLRGDPTMGINVTNIQTLTDTRPGDANVIFVFHLHREHPPLSERSRPLDQQEIDALNVALRYVDRQLQDGHAVVEAIALLSALPTDIEAWLARAADQALATASEEERKLWAGRPPVEVAGEGLLANIRRLQRAFGARG